MSAGSEPRLLDASFYAGDPHPAFRWMREHAPVWRDESCGLWGVSRHADVLAVSRDARTFSSAGGSRPDSAPLPSMINLDDPVHLRRRALVKSFFTPRRVQEREAALRRSVVELIERVAPLGRCDVVRDLAAPLPLIVIAGLLGVEDRDRERLLAWSDALIEGSHAGAGAEAVAAAGRAFGEYAAWLTGEVAGRRARPRDDLLGALVHGRGAGVPLGEEALLHESLLLLVGGDETTRHVLSGGLHQLLLHPQQRRRLAEDPALLPRAVEEMLRFVTPIQNMCRTATRDVVLGGARIRAGERLLLLYPSANRDAAVFADPDHFEPGRQPNEHVAFGGRGTHLCLGASLARLEVRVWMEEVLRRLPDLELESSEPPRRRASNFIVGIEALPVCFPARA